ncbi:hypothetical protein, partial [Ciceribacter sichuanensis]
RDFVASSAAALVSERMYNPTPSIKSTPSITKITKITQHIDYKTKSWNTHKHPADTAKPKS